MKSRESEHPENTDRGNDPSRAGRIKPTKSKAAAAPAGPARAAAPSGPDMKALLQALKRRWLLAAALSVLLGAAAAAGAWYGLAAKYTAFAQLKIAATTPSLVFRDVNNPDGRNDFATYQRTQAAALKNRYVLNAALKREDVRQLSIVQQQAEPITWLEDELKVELQDGSEIVVVKMIGAEPAELVTLVNAVTQSYLTEIVNVDRKQRSDRLAELDDIYTKSREKLRLKRETLKKRAEEVGGSDTAALNHKQQMLLATFGELKKQHAQVRFELMRAENRLASYKARGAQMDNVVIAESTIKQVLDGDPTVVGYHKTLLKVEEALEKFFAAGARKDDSTVVQLQSRKAGLEKQIADRHEVLRPKVVEALKAQAKEDHNVGLAQLQEEIMPLAAQENTLKGEVEKLAAEADKIGNSSTELEMLRAELKQDEGVLERVGHELDALQIELRSPPRVTMNQEAALAKRDTKRQVAATVLAPVLVALLVCFLVSWCEYRVRRIHSADEVISGLGMRILGTVPPLALARKAPAAEGEETPDDSFQEAIDGIRTMLLRDAATQGTRVVMVTSAVHSEGKTTLAGHLATSLARSGRRTLLLDCDLRRPAAHQLFEVELQPGFSEVLLEEVGLAAAIRPTPLDGLAVMPAGQWDRTVLQALAREGVDKVFTQLAEEFDVIIIDSHPVLEATDALLIGQHADAVIFSLVRDVSQMPHVYAAGQQLTGVGVRILGAVINGMSAEDMYQQTATYRAPLARAA
jgi:capsular exopolysaccharide synthesis family protein